MHYINDSAFSSYLYRYYLWWYLFITKLLEGFSSLNTLVIGEISSTIQKLLYIYND